MEYKVFESMIHPTRMKIIQEIIKRGSATTKDISKVCSDVPQATLYRNINKLVKDNVITIASENKIRGVLEKVYKININPYSKIDDLVKENNTEELLNLFYQFSMNLMSDFQNYVQGDEVDILKDKIGFSSCLINLDEEEVEEFMLEIRESILKRLDNKKTPERRVRKLSTIFIPVDE